MECVEHYARSMRGGKVVIEERCKVKALLDKPTWIKQHRRVYDSEYLSPTLFADAGGDDKSVKIAEPIAFDEQNGYLRNDGTVGTFCNQWVLNNYRIRKLTPKECFRLMGVHDEDFEKIAKNQSNSSLYHLAGDSIIVDVLIHIFKEMI